MPGHKTEIPERIAAALPKGWRDRIDRAARGADTSPADWLRGLIRKGLEPSERAARRKAGGKGKGEAWAVIGAGVALAATILPAPLAAQETDFGSVPIRELSSLETFERFQLLTNCAPVAVLDLGQAEVVRRAMTSRLRAARIYNPAEANNSLFFLSTKATEVSGGVHVETEFFQSVVTSAGILGKAVTWRTSVVVTNFDAAGVVAQAAEHVAQHMDEFIDDYLRVNECGQ
ncbi:hypothetical protein [Candidatus Palauibacter sp.]|uniref:hypothetical protein n=1 Tax=Candidatus Palauibacter sp. TaxID=3101350 RepID=UPI003B51D43A